MQPTAYMRNEQYKRQQESRAQRQDANKHAESTYRNAYVDSARWNESPDQLRQRLQNSGLNPDYQGWRSNSGYTRDVEQAQRQGAHNQAVNNSRQQWNQQAESARQTARDMRNAAANEKDPAKRAEYNRRGMEASEQARAASQNANRGVPFGGAPQGGSSRATPSGQGASSSLPGMGAGSWDQQLRNENAQQLRNEAARERQNAQEMRQAAANEKDPKQKAQYNQMAQDADDRAREAENNASGRGNPNPESQQAKAEPKPESKPKPKPKPKPISEEGKKKEAEKNKSTPNEEDATALPNFDQPDIMGPFGYTPGPPSPKMVHAYGDPKNPMTKARGDLA
jgi:hypothetical protein